MAVRRNVAAPPPEPEGAPMLDMGWYGSNFGIPQGKYALEFHAINYQPTKRDGTAAGNAFLAVNLTAYPLAGGGEPIEEAVSMGRGMTGAFVPKPDGKGIVPIPGTSAQGSGNTNWWFFFKSLLDCGFPTGLSANDLSVLDGVHVHIDRIAEPEDRKQLRNQTGEAGGEQQGRTRTMPVVTEILEDGKPWEGTGGLPTDAAAPTTAPKAGPRAVVAKPVATPARRVATPTSPPAEEVGSTDEDIEQAALQGCTTVLEKDENKNGCTKIKLRTGCFAAVKAAYDDDMAQAVGETYLNSDETINVILGQLGYVCTGMKVTVA